MNNVIFSSLFLGIITIASIAQAQTDNSTEPKTLLEKGTEVIQKTTEQVTSTLNETRTRRESANYLFMGSYSPADLLIPGKMGISLGTIQSADKTWELEYLKGSIAVPFIVKDLGAMTDSRISLIGRSYFGGNSFNISYGVTYFDFSITLGDELLNRMTGTYPSVSLLEIQSLGINGGIGNRWTFNKNFTLGVDWLSWSQPLIQTKKQDTFLDHATNQNDRDDVSKALDLISYFPRLSFLKLQMGLLF